MNYLRRYIGRALEIEIYRRPIHRLSLPRSHQFEAVTDNFSNNLAPCVDRDLTRRMIKIPAKRPIFEPSTEDETQADSSIARAQALADSNSTSHKRIHCEEDESSDIELISVSRTPSSSAKLKRPKSKGKEYQPQPSEVIELLTTDDDTDLEHHPVAGPSTLKHSQPRPITLSLFEEDLQLARKLQQELDDEDRRQREEDDEKSAEYIAWMDKTTKEMDAKRARLARDSGLVYQVVIDAEGRTLEGDEDADNMAQ